MAFDQPQGLSHESCDIIPQSISDWSVKISTFCQKIYISLQYPHFAKISTFCSNINFLLKYPLFAKISTFCQNIHFLLKYPLFAKISTFCQNIHFLPKYPFFQILASPMDMSDHQMTHHDYEKSTVHKIKRHTSKRDS